MILVEYSQSDGVADTKRVDDEMRTFLIKLLRESDSLSEGWNSSWQRLEIISENCSIPGWDGENAKAISTISYNNARHFLTCVPFGIVAPDPGVDIDGRMTLEWRRPDGRLLSLTFDADGNLHYIVFFEFQKFYAIAPISLGYSGKLRDCLQDVIG